jgi:isoaspartyl peptidase/L-asparaginase-like protein (Ntn-hydrolase superfamily)
MMRVCLAKTIVEKVRSSSGKDAAREAIAMMERRTKLTETGGVIVVARDGSLGLARTTRTMTWAAVTDTDRNSGA